MVSISKNLKFGKLQPKLHKGSKCFMTRKYFIETWNVRTYSIRMRSLS